MLKNKIGLLCVVFSALSGDAIASYNEADEVITLVNKTGVPLTHASVKMRVHDKLGGFDKHHAIGKLETDQSVTITKRDLGSEFDAKGVYVGSLDNLFVILEGNKQDNKALWNYRLGSLLMLIMEDGKLSIMKAEPEEK